MNTASLSTSRSLPSAFVGALALGLWAASSNAAAAQSCAFAPLGQGTSGTVFRSLQVDEGAGPSLIVGGTFLSAGGLSINNIARWNGQGWSPLGLGVSGTVRALHLHNDGTGEQLYVGGQFFSAGGLSGTSFLARWNGSAWSTIPGKPNGDVFSLATFDDGSGPELYVSGDFTQAGGQSASRIARWNGSSWSALGAGLNSRARDLQVYDDGSGPALYVAGDFTTVNGQPASLVARYRQGTWTPIGQGLTGGGIEALEVYQGSLYAAGSIRPVGAPPIGNFVVRWNGSSWTTVGDLIDNGSRALTVADLGQGPELFVGGSFQFIGNVETPRVARWNGQAWVSLGQSNNQQEFVSVDSLGSFVQAGARSLVLGGGFTTWNGAPANRIVAFACTTPIQTLQGCIGNQALLTADSSAVTIGQPFAATLSSSGFADGFAQLYVGASGVNAGGCGLPLPGLGELLLAALPEPTPTDDGVFNTGAFQFQVAVPNNPSLVGKQLALQAVAVGLSLPGFPAVLSNALIATVQQ
jgi:hypothetical protein